MAPTEIIIGTCGFPVSREKLFSLVDGVEVQESFYNLLGEKSIDNLKKRPVNFHLTFKAWQTTTHPYTSPTWRKMKNLPPGDRSRYGWLKCTNENLSALEKTMEQALMVKAEVIVFQTPSNMPINDEKISDVKCFFVRAREIGGSDILIAWEPRGTWLMKNELLKEISDLGIIIVTDYLRTSLPFFQAPVGYTRLHGLGGTEVNYKYKYTDRDLLILLDVIKGLETKKVYVMFNNVYMLEDAIRFKKLLTAQVK